MYFNYVLKLLRAIADRTIVDLSQHDMYYSARNNQYIFVDNDF